MNVQTHEDHAILLAVTQLKSLGSFSASAAIYQHINSTPGKHMLDEILLR
jgi:hypothetical protein